METSAGLYTHERLKGHKSIRLLRLLPSQDKSDRSCIELTEVSLEKAMPYEALSYTWGTYSDNEPIHCDGETLRVTPNFEAALRQLRLPDKGRLLWIDAICIDQKCIEERNQQVRIMGSIYQNARCVLIWLGEWTTDSDLALAILNRFKEIIDVNGVERDEFVSERLKEIRGTVLFWTITLVLIFVFIEYDRNSNSPQESILQDLFKRSWFRRMWTVQEVALAHQPLVFCGSSSIPWDVFVFAVHRLSNHVAQTTGSQRTEGRLNTVMSLHGTLRDLLPPSDKTPRYHRRWPSLTEVLVATMGKGATEPKDRIFAIYGVTRALGIDFPEPDYDKPVEQVYREAARTAIDHDRDLSMLCHITGLQALPGIPSWIPYWGDELQPNSISLNCF